jgi:hypothetical protein
MKVVMVTKISGPVHCCGEYDMLIGWVMMRAGVKIKVIVGRFAICLKIQSYQVSYKYLCPERVGGCLSISMVN